MNKKDQAVIDNLLRPSAQQHAALNRFTAWAMICVGCLEGAVAGIRFLSGGAIPAQPLWSSIAAGAVGVMWLLILRYQRIIAELARTGGGCGAPAAGAVSPPPNP